MWAPVAQPQPWLTHPLSLPEWVTLEDFESEPQSYNGGNIMVEEPPISFSPFTLANCTLFSHFSFNDFIATACYSSFSSSFRLAILSYSMSTYLER